MSIMIQSMDTRILKAVDTVPSGHSYSDGTALYDLVSRCFAEGVSVVVDFDGLHSLTSGFLNAFIGRLLNERGIDGLKGIISFKGLTPTAKTVLVNYFDRFASGEKV